MKTSTDNLPRVLILGIGNVLMGDEGVGVHVVNALDEAAFPPNVECLDGGVGSFLLLEPMQSVDKVILIDATIDGQASGSVRRLTPKFSTDYPNTLTAHDIGLKDLLDAFYLMGTVPEVVLYAVSITDLQDMVMDLSPELQQVVPQIVKMVMTEATVPPIAIRSSELCA